MRGLAHIAVAIAALGALVLVTAPVGPLGAQEDEALAASEHRLRARIAEAPADVGARCALGFVLVRRARSAEALEVLDEAVTALERSSSRAERARLGACLYNRGRAHESLGALDRARQDYERSLAERPNEAVRARLASLAPPPSAHAARASSPEALALALCASRSGADCEAADPRDGAPRADVVGGECDDGTRWTLVRVVDVAPFLADHVHVLVAARAGSVVGTEVYREAWPATFTARRRPLGALGCGVVLERRVAMPTRIPAEEGFAHDHGLHFAWLRGDAVAHVTVPTDVLTEDVEVEIEASLDEQARLHARRVRGRVPAPVEPLLGVHPLDALAR